ncbi:ABC transporter permease [Limimaricola soesokkakensis]|uniref:ABC transporter permease n=1 Tax=Limimaricola soesokkakensis TaxID=1343159 RepID=UPI00351234D2
MSTTSSNSRSMLRFDRLLAIGKHLGVFIVIIALWELASRIGLIDTILLPPPHEIGAGIVDLYFETGAIYRHFGITLYEALAGFVIGGGIGLGLAVGSALNPSFRRYVAPYAIVLNVTPGLALTPIVIAWFGFGYSSKIALGAIVCFFPVFVNTLIALTRGDEDTIEMFQSMGASRWQTFTKLQVPQALPLVFAGFKIAITTALVGAVVAEFSQGTAGIGILMQRFAFALDMGAAIAALLSMSLLGLLLFYLIEILDDWLVFWRRDTRMAAVGRRRKASWEAALKRNFDTQTELGRRPT